MIDSEDNMIIMNGQQPFLLRFEPLSLLKRTAFWTMPILARLIAKLPTLAFKARLQDSTQGRRAAIQNGTHGFGLLIRESMSAFVFADMFAEDVSHFVFHP